VALIRVLSERGARKDKTKFISGCSVAPFVVVCYNKRNTGRWFVAGFHSLAVSPAHARFIRILE
jgi:hypothetical protein